MPSPPASFLAHETPDRETAAGPEAASQPPVAAPGQPSVSQEAAPSLRSRGPRSIASSAAPPSLYSVQAPTPKLYDDAPVQYSSFPSAQSPPPTASTAHAPPSLLAPSPARPFPFSHDDTEKSRLAYETLAVSAKAYRVALGQLSAAASNFGAALEACARLKEARAEPYPLPGPYAAAAAPGGHHDPHHSLLNGAGGGGGSPLAAAASCTADVLLATSGLYYLMANQQGILAETVYRAFELPVVHELDRYCADLEAEQESYAAGMREASREIRRLEKEGTKLRKPRQRDVGRMRSHLVAMTAALDALTARQGQHAAALLDQSRDMSGTVSQAGRNLVRAEMDILDSLARKGWPGGGLDVVLEGAVDLFSRAGDDDEDDGGDGGIGSSSHAVVSGASGLPSAARDLSLGPKLLLLGGGGPVSGSLSPGGSDDLGDDVGNEGEDENESDVSTVDGNTYGRSRGKEKADYRSPSPDDTTSEPRGRPSRKQKRPKSKRQQPRQQGGGGDDTAQEGLQRPRLHYARADSLSVDPETGYQYQYQSLDSLAAFDAGSDGASTNTATASSRQQQSPSKGGGRGRGGVRPFSPQRVAVGPQEDIFTGAEAVGNNTDSAGKSTLVGEGDEEEMPTAPQGEPAEADDELLTSDDKGKETAIPAASASSASSTIPTPAMESHDTDEGVHAWREGA